MDAKSRGSGLRPGPGRPGYYVPKTGTQLSRTMTKQSNGLRKAAAQGDKAGQYGLGVMYLVGQGLPQDIQQAKGWLRKAGRAGRAPCAARTWQDVCCRASA